MNLESDQFPQVTGEQELWHLDEAALDHLRSLPQMKRAYERQTGRMLGRVRRNSLSSETYGINLWATVCPYPSHGSHYYRFVWGRKSKTCGIKHIPGGDVHSIQAIANARQVQVWIKEGLSPEDIERRIGSDLARGKRGRKPF